MEGATVRTAFHQQLSALTTRLAEACQIAGRAMQCATLAVLRADIDLADSVVSDSRLITSLTGRAEEQARELLALQAPVAGDLRTIVAAIHIAADVDRMGGLARHVAETVRRRHPGQVLPADVSAHFVDMSGRAVALGNIAQQLLLIPDSDRATQLRLADRAMDDLYRELFDLVCDPGWQHGVAAAVDATLLGRFYERFADHAVAVAQRVVFQTTGEWPSATSGAPVDAL